MRDLITVLALLSAVLLVAAPSRATVLEPADLWVAFDAAGTQTFDTPPPYTTKNVFYVLTTDVELLGYEFAIELTDPNIIAFAANELVNPGGSINAAEPPWGWIVGVGTCAGGPGILPLVSVTYGFFVPTVSDVLICMGPVYAASLSPPVPAYLDCIPNILPFGVPSGDCSIYPAGCAVLYPTHECGVAAETHTWGAVKATY